jgi:hypothetical protein
MQVKQSKANIGTGIIDIVLFLPAINLYYIEPPDEQGDAQSPLLF